MVLGVVDLGRMEVGTASHDVVANFLSAQATGAINTVSNPASGSPAVGEFLDL
jgi:hypothetical protein